MNLNKLLKDILKTATGLPVDQDEYDGTSDKYIVFTYINERGEVYADNKPVVDGCYLQIQLITPKSYNYFNKKKLIRDALEENDFTVESIQTFLGDVYTGTEKIRKTIFEVHYAEAREEKEI